MLSVEVNNTGKRLVTNRFPSSSIRIRSCSSCCTAGVSSFPNTNTGGGFSCDSNIVARPSHAAVTRLWMA
jgi:hypothetical protein